MSVIIFKDTSHSLPSKLPSESGEDLIEQKIHEAVKGKHKAEQQKKEQEERLKQETQKKERLQAERALGEFLGFDMWPTRTVEFKGYRYECPGCCQFRVGGYVFRMNRITSNTSANLHGEKLDRKDFSFQIATEFERIYGNRKIVQEAMVDKKKETQGWEWKEIKSLIEIPELRREGKLDKR